MPAPKAVQQQIEEALALLPETGEIEFDAYKALLQAQNPDGAKEVFTQILKKQMLARRLITRPLPATVMLSRKAV